MYEPANGWVGQNNGCSGYVENEYGTKTGTFLFYVLFFKDLFFQCGDSGGVNDEAEDPHGRGRARGHGQAHGAPRGLARDAQRGQVKFNYRLFFVQYSTGTGTL